MVALRWWCGIAEATLWLRCSGGSVTVVQWAKGVARRNVVEGRSLFNTISPDSVPHRPVSSSHVTVSLEQTRFNDDGGACKGLDRTECVVKTTMVAHTDYVYTQDINGP
ncbi:Phytosulfokines 1 [Spatholobus suberectus]|nr:Phytosulfokines 1 [Spatholobus suberectus]